MELVTKADASNEHDCDQNGSAKPEFARLRRLWMVRMLHSPHSRDDEINREPICTVTDLIYSASSLTSSAVVLEYAPDTSIRRRCTRRVSANSASAISGNRWLHWRPKGPTLYHNSAKLVRQSWSSTNFLSRLFGAQNGCGTQYKGLKRPQ